MFTGNSFDITVRQDNLLHLKPFTFLNDHRSPKGIHIIMNRDGDDCHTFLGSIIARDGCDYIHSFSILSFIFNVRMTLKIRLLIGRMAMTKLEKIMKDRGREEN
jgi:hypothetical protein